MAHSPALETNRPGAPDPGKRRYDSVVVHDRSNRGHDLIPAPDPARRSVNGQIEGEFSQRPGDPVGFYVGMKQEYGSLCLRKAGRLEL